MEGEEEEEEEWDEGEGESVPSSCKKNTLALVSSHHSGVPHCLIISSLTGKLKSINTGAARIRYIYKTANGVKFIRYQNILIFKVQR